MSTDVVPKGPEFSYASKSTDSQATTYFYQFDMPGVNACLLVGIDGEYKGCIGYPGYTKFSVTPGTREVSFTPNAPIKIANLKIDYDFEAGKEYFFGFKNVSSKTESDTEIETQYNLILDTTYGWYLVEKQQALKELNGMRSWHDAI
ncbi:hypothetical protein LHL20_20520 [Alteromonas sp. McT4-15]|uniref:hypothetical protein n=1 Tax=Alteromonas sp. McT4-15 TaxID=2881256 RepID=UPI001CF7F186|nr:hypothetical protein [Alteromonas sp. McT4-15]MCB4438607.1 hypothetical protein [Alteromonas sp. McT4-15]